MTDIEELDRRRIKLYNTSGIATYEWKDLVDDTLIALKEQEEEAKWIREKLGLPADTPWLSGQGETVAGTMHVVCHRAKLEQELLAERKTNQEETARLRTAIEAAPHEQSCPIRIATPPHRYKYRCSCWKHKALSGK